MYSTKTGRVAASAICQSGCVCHRADVHALTQRITTDLSRRGFVAGMAASLLALALPKLSSAQSGPPPAVAQRPILFTNFRLFDGKSSAVRDGFHLVVRGNQIESLAQGSPVAPDGAQTIDCGGKVLMPGMIDMHWHSMFAALPIFALQTADVGYIHLAASAEAERTLMRGFTTIRDMGGPAFALSQAIRDGLVSGPRIYPSGAMITTTGGHGDLRMLSDVPREGGTLSHMEKMGGGMIADNADELRMRVREQFLQGASQIKLVGSGGVSSPRSPLDMLTFTEAQLRAGVETARDWGTYVTVHAYTPAAIQRAIASGAQCIEHAHLMDVDTAKLMADKGIWLSIQPFLSDADSVPLTGPSRVRMLEVFGSTDQAYRFAREHKIKTAFGSDLLFSSALATRQGTMLTHLTRWYTAAEVLTMATSTNAELLALSGPRNPFPGKLGVIEQGAFADMLLVDGNPLENIALIEDPAKNLLVIMKDGKIHKDTRTNANTLAAGVV